MEVSTSILSTSNKEHAVYMLNDTTSEYIHIDVMDGKFVPNTCFTIKEIANIQGITKKKLDIHLMVEEPDKYINQLTNKNVEYITFHIEINQNIQNIINQIKSMGIKCGISIKPETNKEKILPYLDQIDLVLIMSVKPGFGGQQFIPESIDKVRYFRNYIDSNNLNNKIEIDGGINDNNAKILQENGIDIIVCGSFITKSDNYQNQIKKLYY